LPSVQLVAPHVQLGMTAVTHVPLLPPLHDASSPHTQVPALHLNPGGHSRPQAPHEYGSLWRSLQATGFIPTCGQQVRPGWQAGNEPHAQGLPPGVPLLVAHFSPGLHPTSVLPAKQPQVPLVLSHHAPFVTSPHSPSCVQRQWVPEALQSNPSAAQLAEQLPQFALVAFSQPSSGVPGNGLLQFTYPLWQYELHCTPEHASDVTFAEEHTRPQAPQLRGSLWIFFSQPLSLLGGLSPSQSPQLETHECWQVPTLVQNWLALLVVLQAALHAPQCFGSLGETSQPSAESPLQFL
jgi:hypothetical protein